MNNSRKIIKDLEYYLEEINVNFPGCWKNEYSPILKNWYAVSNEKSIIAYFGSEKEAFSFKLNYINNKLNK